jgi:glutamate-5-semialdehyde dehydrogenase
MKLLDSKLKDEVLRSMIDALNKNKHGIIEANKKDLDAFNKDDQALYDRLIVNEAKVDDMIRAVQEVKDQDDPVGKMKSSIRLDSGLEIINKTDPFGTILIIYESRPDVTIEAAVLAFKANNKILLKGGKEAYHSNIALEQCWHEALKANGVSKDWINLMHLDRNATQEFLRNPDEKLDLIVPRGGERLIGFVKEHAQCAVLVSGRGNNFLYVSPSADWEMSKKVIINAKTDKISGCNALDKVLLDKKLPDLSTKIKDLVKTMEAAKVSVVGDETVEAHTQNVEKIEDNALWKEEFLAMKILIAVCDDIDDAIKVINENSGKHSSVIMTSDKKEAEKYMQEIDAAAVYQNASSRFTDGGQMGVGAELAISTDKLHHRGPLGLEQLVTNKYYVFGDGHIRNS